MCVAGKCLKWAASGFRVVLCLMINQGRLKISKGKPLYLGKSARIRVSKGGSCRIGAGVYLSRGCLLQINSAAELVVEEGVFFNENSRVVAQEAIHIGANTLFGPNVCVYDHNHIFSKQGVQADLTSNPISIGSNCWIAANSLITSGVEVVDRCLIGGGSVVTRPLMEAGVYVGTPARLIKAIK